MRIRDGEDDDHLGMIHGLMVKHRGDNPERVYDSELQGQVAEALAEVKQLRERVRALEAERWPIPGTEGAEEYTARALLGLVVTVAAVKARSHRVRRLAQLKLCTVTGLSRSSCDALLKAYGYDPVSGEELPEGSS